MVMSVPSQGASGPSGHAGLLPILIQPTISPEQSMFREIRKLTYSVETLLSRHEESSVTKEQFDALVKRLDRLGLGTNGGDGVHNLQPTRNDAQFVTLEQIKDKLQEISARVGSANYMGNDDRKAVFKLMDEVRAAVVDCESLAPISVMPGESPPPAPRACFGRDDLIEEIVGFAENITPVALIGAGGIGKTSIVLKVLHHHRVKLQFGENRKFIRCDQFPATLTHLLDRLSKVIGASIENPEDLTSLYPFLTSRKMIVVLDNAESILDPRGTDAAKIYAFVGELSRLETMCLCITSRMSTIPPDFETVEIPTLPVNAAQDTFYRIYKKREQPDLINDILEQLDFHPLSIALLATVAYENRWGMDQLTREWESRRTSVLRTQHDNSLAATIELSLASPLFQDLGPDARGLLGVVAFFPQGVDEKNLDWWFPTISNKTDVFNKFCILSLTYRSNGFVTMLAPLRDYLYPKEPKTSPLLRTTKERYFARMSIRIDMEGPSFKESRWIVSEDANIEHLLDVFTTIDANSDDVWEACANFMAHLCLHKRRHIVLGPKIEGLPDDHRSKPRCLSNLSSLRSFRSRMERKEYLTHALRFWRERGSDRGVAETLGNLSELNWEMGLPKEGAQQAREALEIFERLGDAVGQADCLIHLASSSSSDEQLTAAEEVVSRAINLLPDEGKQCQACQYHDALGDIYASKGETKKAIHHYEVALGIASSFGWNEYLYWICSNLVLQFLIEGRFDDAQAHVDRAKSQAVDNAYNLGNAMELQALVWSKQHRLEEARSEVLHAIGIFEKLGATENVEHCRELLLDIQGELKAQLPLANGNQIPATQGSG